MYRFFAAVGRNQIVEGPFEGVHKGRRFADPSILDEPCTVNLLEKCGQREMHPSLKVTKDHGSMANVCTSWSKVQVGKGTGKSNGLFSFR